MSEKKSEDEFEVTDEDLRDYQREMIERMKAQWKKNDEDRERSLN